MTNNEQKLPACPYCGSKTGEHSADYPHPSAAPTVAAGLPSRKPVQSNLDSESNSQNRGWNRCHDAFTAWLSKAAQGLPEPVARLEVAEDRNAALEVTNLAWLRGLKDLGKHTVVLLGDIDACTPVVAGMAARNAELEAEVGRLHRRLRAEQAYVSELAAESSEFEQERDTLRTANAKLVEALQYTIAQVPELGTVPGIADALLASVGGGALADEAPKS